MVKQGKSFLKPKDILQQVGLVPEMSVADLGCGSTGFFSIESAKIVGEDGSVYAVDVLQEALDGVLSNAKWQGIDNIKTIWADLEKSGSTGIKENSLDLGMLVMVLFQAADRNKMIEESVRLIKKGGKLLLVDWDNNTSSFGPPTEKRIDKEKVKKFLNKLGLKLVSEFEASPYHFGLIFEK